MSFMRSSEMTLFRCVSIIIVLLQVMAIQPYHSSSVSAWNSDNELLIRNKRDHNPVAPNPSTGKNGSVSNVTTDSVKNPVANSVTARVVKEKTLVIPDRSPANLTSAQVKEESGSEEEGNNSDNISGTPSKGDFDEKAVQRAIIVIGGIAVMIAVYLGIKFALVKRRKVAKRYGRIESSEMDLLDEVEDDESEEEELFDISQHQQRRS